MLPLLPVYLLPISCVSSHLSQLLSKSVLGIFSVSVGQEADVHGSVLDHLEAFLSFTFTKGSITTFLLLHNFFLLFHNFFLLLHILLCIALTFFLFLLLLLLVVWAETDLGNLWLYINGVNILLVEIHDLLLLYFSLISDTQKRYVDKASYFVIFPFSILWIR